MSQGGITSISAAAGGTILIGPTIQFDVLVGGATPNSVGNVGPGTAGQVLQSGGAAANPAYSTAIYPATTTINQILFSNAANNITGITSANSGVLTTSTAGVPSIDTTNFHVLSTGVQVKGNNTNTAPPAGFIGEQMQSVVTSALGLTNATAANLAVISLTAGVWDVTFFAVFSGGAVTATQVRAGISTTSLTFQTQFDSWTASSSIPTAAADSTITIPAFRIILNATTSVYAVVRSDFTVGTVTALGRLSAVRVG